MKKQQKKICLIILIIFISLLFFSNLSLANDNGNLELKPLEYSDDFKEWLKLSDEEKSKYRNYERGIQYLLQKYIASLRREMGYPHKLQIRSEFR